MLPGSGTLHNDFWALHDINFTVEKGETLGLVGPNGCGKSTLLQIVSGILQPTTGRVVTRGRVAALLELGAGFNPEFSDARTSSSTARSWASAGLKCSGICL